MGGVAIIIAAKDARCTIGRAVRDALQQDCCDQVIIVDDCSTDDTADVARAMDDGSQRLQIFRLERNLGPAGARNVALAAARTQFVAVLDADDGMEPGRLARLVMRAGDTWDFVADDLWIGDDGGGRRQLWADGPFADFPLDLATLVIENTPRPDRPQRELGFLKPLMRRSFLLRAGLGYDARLRLGEDFDLYARALNLGARFLVVAPEGYVAWRRDDSLSARHTTADLVALCAAMERLAADRATPSAALKPLLLRLRQLRKEIAWRRMIDAVKRRQPREALAALSAGPAQAAFVGAQLLDQAVRRLTPWKPA